MLPEQPMGRGLPIGINPPISHIPDNHHDIPKGPSASMPRSHHAALPDHLRADLDREPYRPLWAVGAGDHAAASRHSLRDQ
ncbi:hypothetical protein GCM10023075_63110 [Streptosporangium album]